MPKRQRLNGCITRRPKLDPAIWSLLPEELHRNLLEHLPLASLCRFRTVCKPWYKTIARIKVAEHGRWYTRIKHSAYFNFKVCIRNRLDEVGRRWRVIEMNDAPMATLGSNVTSVASVSSNGFLCMSSFSGKRLFLFNPLSNSCVELPEPPPVAFFKSPAICFLGIQSLDNEDVHNYQDSKPEFLVVCAKFDERALGKTILHVYDSRKATWVCNDIALDNEIYIAGTEMPGSGVLYNFNFYFITLTRTGIYSLKSIRVLEEDKKPNTLATWTSLPLKIRRGQPTDAVDEYHPRVAVCNGKLVMVSILPWEPGAKYGTVAVLVFEQSWEVVSVLPLEKIPRKYGLEINVCLSAAGLGDELGVAVTDIYWGCVYNFSSNSWSPLPGVVDDINLFLPIKPSFLRLKQDEKTHQLSFED